MLIRLEDKLTKKDKTALGGFYYGIKLKSGYYFPLSGMYIPYKKIKEEGKQQRIRDGKKDEVST